jgi:hypothetical protein
LVFVATCEEKKNLISKNKYEIVHYDIFAHQLGETLRYRLSLFPWLGAALYSYIGVRRRCCTMTGERCVVFGPAPGQKATTFCSMAHSRCCWNVSMGHAGVLWPCLGVRRHCWTMTDVRCVVFWPALGQKATTFYSMAHSLCFWTVSPGRAAEVWPCKGVRRHCWTMTGERCVVFGPAPGQKATTF